MSEQKKKTFKPHWSRVLIGRVWDYTDWLWWVILGFFIKTVLVRLGWWGACDCCTVDMCNTLHLGQQVLQIMP